MSSTTDRFWDRICDREHQFVLMFVLTATFLLLSLIAVPVFDLNTVTGTILQFNLVIFTTLVFPLAFVLYRCRQRKERYRAE